MKRATLAARLEAFSASFDLLGTIKKARALGVESLQDAEDQARECFREALADILAAVLEVLPDLLPDPGEAADPAPTAYVSSPPTLEFKLYDPAIAAPEIGMECIVALKSGPASGAVTDGNIRTANGWQKGQDPWTPRGDVWWCYSPDVTTWASTTNRGKSQPETTPSQVAVATLAELRGLRAELNPGLATRRETAKTRAILERLSYDLGGEGGIDQESLAVARAFIDALVQGLGKEDPMSPALKSPDAEYSS